MTIEHADIASMTSAAPPPEFDGHATDVRRTEVAIELVDVTKRFGATAVVDHVNLRVMRGEFLTLLGPSGCGKTTTLRMLAGFVRPDEGVVIAGERVLSSPTRTVPPERRRMGMVFQDYAVWPHKSVFQNVAFGLQIKRVSKREITNRVARILELVDLNGFGQRRPEQLSGGQLQRVALARALVVEPEILLLDEPLSNLDAKLRERMRLEIKELQRRTGITFIYVTHDQAEAMALADRIVVMNGGRLQQVGTPREVYGGPRNRMVAEFMGQVNFVAGSMSADAAGRAVVVTGGGIRVSLPFDRGLHTGDRIVVAIRPEDIEFAPNAAPPGRSDRTRARVTSAVYLGNTITYEVSLEDSSTLHVQTAPSRALEVGETVELEVRRASLIDGTREPEISPEANER